MALSWPGAAPEASQSHGTRGLHALLLVSLLTCVSACGSRVCGREAIRMLQNVTKLLRETSEGKLYTPEDITVCTVENLNCFHTELLVIQWEHGEHRENLSLLIQHLRQLERLKQKASPSKTDRPCPPCEGHQEQPVPHFLSKLLELLQRECWLQGSNTHSCPPWPG